MIKTLMGLAVILLSVSAFGFILWVFGWVYYKLRPPRCYRNEWTDNILIGCIIMGFILALIVIGAFAYAIGGDILNTQKP